MQRHPFKTELRAALAREARGLPLTAADHDVFAKIAWLRRTQGEVVAKQIACWAVGKSLTAMASHERCCEKTLRTRIYGSLAALTDFHEPKQLVDGRLDTSLDIFDR